jgi:hypothetical protein
LQREEVIVDDHARHRSLAGRSEPAAPRTGASVPGRPRTPTGDVQPNGRRRHERRFCDDAFYLMERRNGDVWTYGSISLCVALWGVLGVLLLR